MLNQVFESGLLKSVNQLYVENVPGTSFKDKDYTVEIVGLYINLMCPSHFRGDEHWCMKTLFGGEKEKVEDNYKIFVFCIPLSHTVTENIAGKCSYHFTVEGNILESPFKIVSRHPKALRTNMNRHYIKQYLHWKPACELEDFSKIFSTHDVGVGACPVPWPVCANEWASRVQSSEIINTRVVYNIMETGCHAVPYIKDFVYSEIQCDQPLEENTDDTLWAISFAVAEKEYCRYLTVSQKHCFLLFKSFLHESIMKHRVPHFIPLHLFFYACDNVPRVEWKTCPGRCFLILLKTLLEGFRKRFLPHYFIAQKNLLKNVSETVQKDIFEVLTCYKYNPLWAIYKALDVSNLTNCDISSLVENISFEATQYVLNNLTCTLASDMLMPAFQHHVKNMVASSKYNAALSTMKKIIPLDDTVSIEELTKYMLPSIHIHSQWGLCVYLDIQVETSLTKTVFNNMPCIHISEVFGEKSASMVLNTCIPEEAAIVFGDLAYPSTLFHVLRDCGKEEALIECHQFYLRKYIETAGDSLVIPAANKNSASTSQTPGDPTALAMTNIYNVHIELYNTCKTNWQFDTYREFLPHLEKVVAILNEDFYYQNLYVVQSGLALHSAMK